ncbi:MAG: lysostaphin resistance A-like protein [Chloroflexota bacterium]
MLRTFLGVAGAAPLWAWVFRGKPDGFWKRMALAAGSLGGFALLSEPDLRRRLLRPADIPEGVASAAGLYLIFQAGDRLARIILPAGGEEIEAIYQLRTSAPRSAIAALLTGIIAPSEVLFWQGLVQRSFMRRFGRWPGTLLAVASYGGIHLLTGNLTLSAAATTAGAYWGTEYALTPRLGANLVSHVLWDVWIFLIAPTPGGRRRPV